MLGEQGRPLLRLKRLPSPGEEGVHNKHDIYKHDNNQLKIHCYCHLARRTSLGDRLSLCENFEKTDQGGASCGNIGDWKYWKHMKY